MKRKPAEPAAKRRVKPPSPPKRANSENWQQYDESDRPPLPLLTQWLRLYRYYLPMLRDIRQRDRLDVSPDTIRDFKSLLEEMHEVAALFDIKVIVADTIMPKVDDAAIQREHYASRLRELSAQTKAAQDLANQQLQAQAEELERSARARHRQMREMGMFKENSR
jgi:hypothetical protein